MKRAVFVVKVLLAVEFCIAGTFALIGHEIAVRDYTAWGYPKWLWVGTGILSLVAAPLLFWRKTVRLAAIPMLIVWLDNSYRHSLQLEWGHTLAGLTVSSLIAWVVIDDFQISRGARRQPHSTREAPTR